MKENQRFKLLYFLQLEDRMVAFEKIKSKLVRFVENDEKLFQGWRREQEMDVDAVLEKHLAGDSPIYKTPPEIADRFIDYQNLTVWENFLATLDETLPRTYVYLDGSHINRLEEAINCMKEKSVQVFTIPKLLETPPDTYQSERIRELVIRERERYLAELSAIAETIPPEIKELLHYNRKIDREFVKVMGFSNNCQTDLDRYCKEGVALNGVLYWTPERSSFYDGEIQIHAQNQNIKGIIYNSSLATPFDSSGNVEDYSSRTWLSENGFVEMILPSKFYRFADKKFVVDPVYKSMVLFSAEILPVDHHVFIRNEHDVIR